MVDILLTVLAVYSGKAFCAVTLIAIDEVDAGCIVLTRGVGTIVNVCIEDVRIKNKQRKRETKTNHNVRTRKNSNERVNAR